ncbi:hypothetical protein MM239_11055 [Belliella sp. DSM 111904]|uniref:Ribbon-helix-helix protein, copG family n=1 Tax=Belliella filtrata TaxID=2923435 RepID=A0ABS9V0T3_9BACT|nr:hypothetical protein [Belliella filtrata]MCH7409933.1 hypothetical protein [Belliella filtrata]
MKRKSIQLSEEFHTQLEQMSDKFRLTKKEVAELSIKSIYEFGIHPKEVKRDQIAASIQALDHNQQAFIKRMEQGPLRGMSGSISEVLDSNKAIYNSQKQIAQNLLELIENLKGRQKTLENDLATNQKYNRRMGNLLKAFYDHINKYYPDINSKSYPRLGIEGREILSSFIEEYEKIFKPAS